MLFPRRVKSMVQVGSGLLNCICGRVRERESGYAAPEVVDELVGCRGVSRDGVADMRLGVER